jgi:hypothetical protein
MPELAKITFILDSIDGYPPVGYESVWAKQVSETCFEIANIPFYAKGVSFDDIVECSYVENEHVFRKSHKDSGNSTLRAIVFAEESLETVKEKILLLGCGYEVCHSSFFAINIPASLNADELFAYLDELQAREVLEVEVGKLNPQHDV